MVYVDIIGIHSTLQNINNNCLSTVCFSLISVRWVFYIILSLSFFFQISDAKSTDFYNCSLYFSSHVYILFYFHCLPPCSVLWKFFLSCYIFQKPEFYFDGFVTVILYLVNLSLYFFVIFFLLIFHSVGSHCCFP